MKAKNPILQATKFSKRLNREVPVIRVYTTKKGGYMYFMVRHGVYQYCNVPYFFWSECSTAYPSLQKFFLHICGLEKQA